MTALVDLVVEAPEWQDALPDLAETAETAARTALHFVSLSPDTHEICVLACDDQRIAALNGSFRGTEAATNVLSWPVRALTPGTAPPPGPLGDIAIALETTRAEADAAGKPLKSHAMHLILHGVLHLLGYDHETDEDAQVMEGIERRALNHLKISDPYA